MIKDLNLIREELVGFIEIELPYDLQKGCHIKYITKKKDEESFFQGGKFNYFGNDCIFLETSGRKWSVPICKRNKNGSINYKSRFFIKEDTDEKCIEDVKKLTETLEYQQSIIEKLSKKNNKLEKMQQKLIDEKRTYEELLQQNRFNLKELSVKSREKDEKITKYEEIIKKLANSHSVFSG